MGKLDGKVALITGGARGQGRAHAVRLAQEGADVAVCDIGVQIPQVGYPLGTDADLKETAAQVEAYDRHCLTVQADVRAAPAMSDMAARCMAEFGRIDILVANAGIGVAGSWDATEDVYDAVVDTNMKGVFLSCQAVIPHIIAGGEGGSLILVSSVAGIQPYFNLLPYVAAKHGVIGLMRGLAADLSAHRIRVNALCPGLVNSPMMMSDYFLNLLSGTESGGTPDAVAWWGRTVHLLPEPWATAEDLAGAAAFLASDDAKCITGTVMPVDLGTSNMPAGISPFGMAELAAARAQAEARSAG